MLGPAEEAQLMELCRKCLHDPEAWAEAAYAWGTDDLHGEPGPRQWQRDVNRIIKDHLSDPRTRYTPCRIAVASGHGVGKSAEMGMLANWATSTMPDTIVLVTANTETQLRTKTSPEIGRWFKRSATAEWFDPQALSIRSKDKDHKDTWKLDFIPWSEHNTEAFAGLHNKRKRILLLMDEASAIADKVWEVAEGALTDEFTEIIWIVFGNPTRATGRFRECFRRLRHRWHHINIDARDVPGTNKQQIAEWEKDYGVDSDWFKVRVRGMFPSASPKQFISGVDVDPAYGRHLRPEQYNFAPKILGIDPAWEGDDEFVIGLRQGLSYRVLGAFEKNDNDIVMANLIARLEDEHQIDGVFIDAGYGTGIASAGKTMGRTWHLVWFAGKSPDPGYLNMRAYIWGKMRDWLKEGATFEPDDILYQDLIGPETVPRLDGKIQLESKNDMKERGVPSPNRADALALTFAFDVPKKQRMVVQDRHDEMPHSRRLPDDRVEADYNPFA